MLVIVSPLPIQARGQTPAAPDTVVVHSGSLTLRSLLWMARALPALYLIPSQLNLALDGHCKSWESQQKRQVTL
jgi:hypothetical protein